MSGSRVTRTAAQRFWPKVNKNGPVPKHRPGLGKCWVWLAYRDAGGYGQFWLGKRLVPAHRAAFFLKHGRMPRDCGLHKCDNPACVRLSHLFDGTQLDNIRDRHAKGRTVIVRRRGTEHHGAVLTDAKVRRIRKLLATHTQLSVAKMLGVTRSCILQIHLGHTWKHVK